MSVEAYRFIWKHAPASRLTGTELLVVLAMADFTADRKAPFVCEVSAADVGRRIGMTSRYVQKVLDRLIESGHIRLVAKGTGRMPNIYSIGRVATSYRTAQATSWGTYLRSDSTEVA